jgi:putative ABC transport system permease protein
MTEIRKPPRILQRLLQYVLPRYVGDTALGDFEEEYDRVASKRGNIPANLWYLIQVIRSIPAFIGDSMRWGSVMFRNYMKITLRNIRRHKVFSFINIVGLAVGMSCVILIMLWIQYETSFDKYHEKADRIFRVAKKYYNDPFFQGREVVVTPPPMSSALLSEFPEIEASARLFSLGDILLSFGEKHFLETIYGADASFFQIFSVPLLKGNANTVLNDPYSIVLSEKAARKYFGNRDPLNEIVHFDQNTDLKVTGVFKDMPSNSHFIADIIIPFKTLTKKFGGDFENWWWNSFYTYILLRPNVNPIDLEAKFVSFAKKYGIASHRLFLQPLLRIHLHSHSGHEIGSTVHVSTLILIGSIAVLILIIACINYMNLTTARASYRSKEVGTRRLVGAHRSQILRQFMGESVLMAIFSLGLSAVLAYLGLPLFNSLAGKHLAFDWINIIQILPFIFVLIIFVGLFAGSYPALLLSSFKPVTAIKGTTERGSPRTRLRNVLVVVQFTVSLVLIIATLLVKNQLEYIKDKEMGFDKDQIVVVEIHDEKVSRNVTPLLEELRRNPNVRYASSSYFLPNDVGSSTHANWPGKPEDMRILIHAGEIGYDYIELYGIEIIMGRSFSRDFPADERGAFLINETAMKVIGENFQLGMGFGHWGSSEPKGRIVGVMKDFHLHSLHEEIKPLYFYLNPKYGPRVSIKIQGGRIEETLHYVQETVKKFSPYYPFEYRFFDEIFNAAYISEQKIERVLTLFALIAVFIACMGVFGLSAFVAEQRRKEIGIRKVLGATVEKIVYSLSKDLIRLVFLANLIAWPLAYYAMNRWLQNFAYRTRIGLGIFILSMFLMLVVSLGTVSYQAVKAALANPVDSLRYE